MYSLGAYEASEPTVIVPSDLIEAGTKDAAVEPVLALVVAVAVELLDEEEHALSSSAPARTTPVTAGIRFQPKLLPLLPIVCFRVDKAFLHLLEVSKIASYSHANHGLLAHDSLFSCLFFLGVSAARWSV
jgi:hypothetical protein